MTRRQGPKRPNHWNPASWEEKGYVLYDQIEAAARQLGPAAAADLAEQAIALVVRALREPRMQDDHPDQP